MNVMQPVASQSSLWSSKDVRHKLYPCSQLAYLSVVMIVYIQYFNSIDANYYHSHHAHGLSDVMYLYKFHLVALQIIAWHCIVFFLHSLLRWVTISLRLVGCLVLVLSYQYLKINSIHLTYSCLYLILRQGFYPISVRRFG